MKDNNFEITLEGFNEGFTPLAHIDDKTFIGNKGQASAMQADIITKPGFLTQSPALVDLTNGNQAGVVSELVRFIMDIPVSSTYTYAVGTGKLFKLSSSMVVSGGSPSWPQTITGMTSGESVIRLKTNVYVFYNKSSGGDIAKMPISTESITANWGSATDAALENALHPSAAKEDIMLFGNGRYVGVYVEGLGTLDVQKLDFGEEAEVADIVFAQNLWWIAVNIGQGTRKRSQVFMYDGSAISNILSDEAGIGIQKIGFLYVLNGTVWICYQDLTTNAYTLGFFNGRQIKPLVYFSGTLPDHRQKTLYLNTILFVSDDALWSGGAVVDQLPIQISKHADAGYSTVGGVAAPFGTPMVASTDGGSNFRLAKFSGYSTNSIWKSFFIDITRGRMLGKINDVVVFTKKLAANARCDITIEGNQAYDGDSDNISDKISSTFIITGEGISRHSFGSIGLSAVEDIRVVVDYSNGDGTNDCPVRKIYLGGNHVER